MKDYFKDYLFNHQLLVSETAENNYNNAEAIEMVGKFFNIRIVSGQELFDKTMIPFIGRNLGVFVPEPFYKGFPESVLSLSKDELFFDQLIHYCRTYGYGDFSQAGHSLFEGDISRAPFKEESEPKKLVVISEAQAETKLKEYAENLFMSTRPLSDSQFTFVCQYIEEYDYQVKKCPSKNLVIRLLLKYRNVKYAELLTMSDVIKLVDEMNYEEYGNKNIKKLNLKNQDRKFITNVINELFHASSCDIQECCEKKAIWNGLLHHIHYRPIDEVSKQFVDVMRGEENLSVYSQFEKALAKKDIKEALEVLKKGKGSGAVLRHLDYIVTRCNSKEDVEYVTKQIESSNGIVLLQLLMHYGLYIPHQKRTFKFVRHNMMVIHHETEAEAALRKGISKETAEMLVKAVKENLVKVYAGRLNRVYIDPSMKNIALPLQEGASSGGYGILPKGSRIHIPENKKIRGFTYWEKVNDIDLSVIGLYADGSQKEFSWRSMRYNQSKAIVFSGDQTSGYDGGSEYFDIDVQKFKKKYPNMTHLVFCDNVYSSMTFDKCICTAGYMVRDKLDSGEVFEPKTVQSSFTINCDSRFACLFAIDLETNDFIWLNLGLDSMSNIAGTKDMTYIKQYFDLTSIMNLYDLLAMMATEVVDDISKADIVVTDQTVDVDEGVEVIHSLDMERITALMNQR